MTGEISPQSRIQRRKELEDLSSNFNLVTSLVARLDETESSLKKQAKYEKQIKFSVERTPNYRSRLQECHDMNMIEIDMRNER